MELLELKVMRGPSYWSVIQPRLIVVTLRLCSPDFTLSNSAYFKSRLRTYFPAIYLTGNVSLAQLVKDIAVDLLGQADIDTHFSKVEEAKENLYRILISYQQPGAVKLAVSEAFEIVSRLGSAEEIDLPATIDQIKTKQRRETFGPSTASIVQEAERRNIPVIKLDNDCFVQLGYGAKQKRIQATISSTTSNIAVDIAGDKEATKALLRSAEVPVPKGASIYSEDELLAYLQEENFPLVIKPVDGNHGKGATTNITNEQQALEAFNLAKQFSRRVIVERFITGSDFRVLVINNKFEAAAMRTPASVVGDGKRNIEELVELVNADPQRGIGHDNILTQITVDDATVSLLHAKGYTTKTVLKKGEMCFLKPTANLSTGGTATDVTDTVHPQNILLFQRIARIISLDICGIDVIAENLSTPIKENGGVVLEVNAAPGFRMHLQPTHGTARNVAKPVIDMLFPNNSNGRIPIVAITGTNGKTTTTRLIAHIGKMVGNKVGYTTTDGVYIQDEVVTKGDCAGPTSAELVLKDPSIDLAVLECARGGMLRSGLAFSCCDVAVITNVAEDHLGLNGIDTIEELAEVKSVVAQSVSENGFAVLNADDDLVYAMKDRLKCQVALFSLNDKSARIKRHVQNGGVAAVCERNYITIMHGNKKMRIDKLANIPVTFNGKAEFNIANSLAASLAAYVRDIRIEDIRKGLQTFIPGAEVTPGRMNIFDFKDFTVMLDYAHNPHGMQALGKFIQAIEAKPKVGVIAGVGDRRDEDLVALGEEAAKTFDEIVIRLDKDLRGRTANEITTLVSRGIRAYDPYKKILLFESEREAIDFVINNAVPGSFVAVLSDTVTDSLDQLKEAKAKRDETSLPYVQSLTA
jgi:cyanophycin synthetase